MAPLRFRVLTVLAVILGSAAGLLTSLLAPKWMADAALVIVVMFLVAACIVLAAVAEVRGLVLIKRKET